MYLSAPFIISVLMNGADKYIILQAVYLLENVDEEDHARTLETLIREYNAPDNNY